MIDLYYKKAEAIVRGSAAYRNVTGKVTFVQKKDGVIVTADIYGLPQGDCGGRVFGFHIHEGRACTGNAADPFADTGMHYNPKNCLHPFHAGDLPPLFESDGRAHLSFTTNRFKLSQVLGRAVVIHSSPDDFTTQPSGNSGEKIACGIIKAEKTSIVF